LLKGTDNKLKLMPAYSWVIMVKSGLLGLMLIFVLVRIFQEAKSL